ncbi:MAG: CDC5 cell division cycle 5-like protein, partial [Paramarteilia canceri]
VWDECYTQLMYLPSKNDFTRTALSDKKQMIEYFDFKLKNSRTIIEKEAKNVTKAEKRVDTLHAGYQNRASGLLKQLKQLCSELDQTEIELDTYHFLLDYEKNKAVNHRLDPLKDLVENAKSRNLMLQERYKEFNQAK